MSVLILVLRQQVTFTKVNLMDGIIEEECHVEFALPARLIYHDVLSFTFSFFVCVCFD